MKIFSILNPINYFWSNLFLGLILDLFVLLFVASLAPFNKGRKVERENKFF